jgi:hypothetical protein
MRVVMAADIAGWRRGNPDRVPHLPKMHEPGSACDAVE